MQYFLSLFLELISTLFVAGLIVALVQIGNRPEETKPEETKQDGGRWDVL